MRDVAVDLDRVVEQIVLRGGLSLLVQLRRPVVELRRAAHEIARGDHGVAVERREEELAVEAVHAAAEAHQAVEDLLPLEQAFESRDPLGVH